jgi:predicted transcriptional regulator
MAKDLVMAQITAGQLPTENMQQALQRTYTSLMALKAQEETGTISPVQIPEAGPDWRKSITKHTVTCLECGLTFKQLSRRHLQDHGLDGRSYRTKYGIPRTQPLAAKDTTAIRKKIVQQTKPWEKAPMFVKAQEGKVAKKTGSRTRRRAAAKA